MSFMEDNIVDKGAYGTFHLFELILIRIGNPSFSLGYSVVGLEV